MALAPRTSETQATTKVEKWNDTTFGQLMRGMRNQDHWPDGLVDELLEAMHVGHYLAHHFLREFYVVEPSDANEDRAVDWLFGKSTWIDGLQDALDQHTKTLGIDGVESGRRDDRRARRVASEGLAA